MCAISERFCGVIHYEEALSSVHLYLYAPLTGDGTDKELLFALDMHCMSV